MTKASLPLGEMGHDATMTAPPPGGRDRPPRLHPALATPPPARVAPLDAMKAALLGSRHRWRELVLLGSDLAFETDRRGRFTLLAPESVLGWSADHLLGQPAALLLAEPEVSGGFNPFRPLAPAYRQRSWLRRSDGSTACLSFAVAPIRDARGRLMGWRGVAQDVTMQDVGDDERAALLRRAELLDHILSRMRQEVMAPRMMQAALQALAGAIGAEGAGVLADAADGTPELRHRIGPAAPAPAGQTMAGPTQAGPTLAAAASDLLALCRLEARAAESVSEDGRRLLACGCETRFGERSALMLWREPGGRAWHPDDLALVAAASGITRVILEHDSIQQEMARQARTDPLTGLLNRRAFCEEVTRRIDRLDHDGVPGSLMFIDLDYFKRINDALGHDVGDEALCIVAGLLRAAVRGPDLVARFGGDEFAVWLDGVDEFSASERAEMLRIEAPQVTAHLSTQAKGAPVLPPLSLSMGIATRWPGSGESLDGLVNRADQVMYDVKRAGRGHWRVSHPDLW